MPFSLDDVQQTETTKTVTEIKPAPPPAPAGTVETKITVTKISPVVAFGRWSAGLIAGFIRGGAHALTSGTVVTVVDSITGGDSQSAETLLSRYGMLFVAHGVVSTMMYLKARPIPPEWDPETSIERRNGK